MGHPSGPDSSNGDLLGRGAPPDDEGEVICLELGLGLGSSSSGGHLALVVGGLRVSNLLRVGVTKPPDDAGEVARAA